MSLPGSWSDLPGQASKAPLTSAGGGRGGLSFLGQGWKDRQAQGNGLLLSKMENCPQAMLSPKMMGVGRAMLPLDVC